MKTSRIVRSHRAAESTARIGRQIMRANAPPLIEGVVRGWSTLSALTLGVYPVVVEPMHHAPRTARGLQRVAVVKLVNEYGELEDRGFRPHRSLVVGDTFFESKADAKRRASEMAKEAVASFQLKAARMQKLADNPVFIARTPPFARWKPMGSPLPEDMAKPRPLPKRSFPPTTPPLYVPPPRQKATR